MITPGAEILVIRFKSLGDILLSTVVPREIVRSFPGVKIDYLVDAPFEGLTSDYPWVRREIVRRPGSLTRAKLTAALKSRYDIVVDMQGSVSSAIIARTAARRFAVGHGGKRASFLYHRQVPPGGPGEHTVESNLHFLQVLGIPTNRPVEIPIASSDEVTRRYCAMTEGRGVLIHPGARFPHKIWPHDRLAEVGRRLARLGAIVHVLVGPGDEIGSALHGFPRLSDIPPRELSSMMKAYKLFISNDSGPAHFAAAAGCHVIVTCGPTDIARWRPYTTNCRLFAASCACGPGWKKKCRTPANWCMNTIGAGNVLDAAVEMFEKTDAAR